MNKETLSTSKEEVPKIKLGLQEKYNQEKKEEPHAKRLDPDNIDTVGELPEPVGTIPSLKLWRLFESCNPFTTSLIVPSPPKTINLSKLFLSIFDT